MDLFKRLKNAFVYDLHTEFVNLDVLDNLRAFQPCSENELYSVGYLPISVDIDDLDSPTEDTDFIELLKAQDYTLVKVGISEKKIPAKQINKLVKGRIRLHKDMYDRGLLEFPEPTKEEIDAFKQDAIAILAPKCFNDDSEHFFAINKTNLIVFSPKHERIKDFLEVSLVVGGVSLTVDFDQTKLNLIADNQLDGQTTATNFIELVSDEGSVVSKKQDVLNSDEVDVALKSHKQVKKLGVDYDGLFQATVSVDGAISGIKFERSEIAETRESLAGSALLVITGIMKLVNELRTDKIEINIQESTE